MNLDECVKAADVLALMDAVSPAWHIAFLMAGAYSVVRWFLDRATIVGFYLLNEQRRETWRRFDRRNP